MLPTFIGLVIFSVGFVFSVSNTKYHILCSENRGLGLKGERDWRRKASSGSLHLIG
jgi:hypothetical protein